VHRLCGVDPLDRLGRVRGFYFFGWLGRERRLDLVRAVPLVSPGVAIGARSGAAIDEYGEAVKQTLKPELEQVIQAEVILGSGEAFEDGEAAGLHD
jgi:hypothetical protein